MIFFLCLENTGLMMIKLLNSGKTDSEDLLMSSNIFIKNIYYMLSYAFQLLNQKDDELIEKESFDNIHNLFAAILSRGIAVQLKQGIYREYISKQEELPVMRGKINIQGTVKDRMQHKQLLSCEYDELSENNLFNQILKSTLEILMKSDYVEREYTNLLRKQMLFFSEIDTIDLTDVRWSSLRFHRNNQSYRMLISVCQLISEGMLLTTDKGDYRIARFIDDQRMSRLYEKFLLEYFTKHYPEISVNAAQIPWALDDGIGTMLPVMQTDITLDKDNTILIIDAKYYSHTTQVNFDKHSIHSNNLYQIFTYVKNRECQFRDEEHSVSGMLLYAKTDEEIQPNQDYQMSGNKISVKTLDLNVEFEKIKEQLDKIVQGLSIENNY